MEIYDYVKPPLPPIPPVFGSDMGKSYQDRYYQHSPNDSRLWLELFAISDKADRTLTEKLEYIRTVGTVLVLDQQYGFKIQPVVGVNGWESIEQYTPERHYLMQHMQTMLQSLGELRRRYDSGKTF